MQWKVLKNKWDGNTSPIRPEILLMGTITSTAYGFVSNNHYILVRVIPISLCTNGLIFIIKMAARGQPSVYRS
jgi:hypothetical protein